MKSHPNKIKTKPRQPKAIREEAERLHRYVVGSTELAEKLTWRFARQIGDPIARGTARMDFDRIVVSLAGVDPETRGGLCNLPQKAMWHRYSHHFQGREAPRKFFSSIDAVAKRYLSDIVYSFASSALDGSPVQVPILLWDETLSPGKAAPHLLRQWTRDCKLTSRFLVALFDHFKRVDPKGSAGRRALLISQAAPAVGFKPAAHTKRLVATGDINLGKHEYPADEKLVFEQVTATVGRSIRRLRDEAKQAKPRQLGSVKLSSARSAKPPKADH